MGALDVYDIKHDLRHEILAWKVLQIADNASSIVVEGLLHGKPIHRLGTTNNRGWRVIYVYGRGDPGGRPGPRYVVEPVGLCSGSEPGRNLSTFGRYSKVLVMWRCLYCIIPICLIVLVYAL